jgi:hypothetical protein
MRRDMGEDINFVLENLQIENSQSSETNTCVVIYMRKPIKWIYAEMIVQFQQNLGNQ